VLEGMYLDDCVSTAVAASARSVGIGEPWRRRAPDLGCKAPKTVDVEVARAWAAAEPTPMARRSSRCGSARPTV
jgi:hypothetical protein